MSTNIFIRIGDIKGESQDTRHKDEIEVLSWAWGVSNTGTMSSSGGGSGRPSFQDVTFKHLIDRASPSLMLACATGEHFKDARLTVRKMGTTTPQEFLLIGLQHVTVTSVQSSGTAEAGGLVEYVTLHFARVDFEYKGQNPDGSLDAGVHFRWDLQSHSTI
jgi:type VI secretion system secreted protein Hcp